MCLLLNRIPKPATADLRRMLESVEAGDAAEARPQARTA
jgi:hypothetical protein